MCGEHSHAASLSWNALGSSPHVRGALAKLEVVQHRVGIIPACAGSTSRLPRSQPRGRDHPRMCGEHFFVYLRDEDGAGSSPHVRGALQDRPHPRQPRGIIPACAGSTCRSPSCRTPRRDHPRMCGEHLVAYCMIAPQGGSSPHVRGAPRGRLPGPVS